MCRKDGRIWKHGVLSADGSRGTGNGEFYLLCAVLDPGIAAGNSGDEGGCQMALIQVDALSFAYPGADRRTLDQISLSIDEEEYVVLCGGSGCGKTTFLRQLKPEGAVK